MFAKIALPGASVAVGTRWFVLASGLAILALSTGIPQAQSQSAGMGGALNPAPKAGDKPPATLSQFGGLGTANSAPRSPVKPIARPTLPPMAPPSVEYFPQPVGTEKRILAALEEDGEFNFTNESLEKILHILGESHQIPFEIDGLHLSEESISAEEKNITIKLSGISLRSALKIMLKRKNLDFLIERDFIRITTKTEAISIFQTRTYPVRDLVGNVDAEYALLSRTIQQTLGGPPDGPWMEADGEGGAVSAQPAVGCLVIRQTPPVHEEVLTLLRSLRKAKSDVAELKSKSSAN